MLALQLAALLLAAAPQKLDLVIEHGRVVDGSGSAWFRADVGIRGDRIVHPSGTSATRRPSSGSTPATRWWPRASSTSSGRAS